MASANDDKDKESGTSSNANVTSQIPRTTSSFIESNAVLNASNQTNLFAPDKPAKASADTKANTLTSNHSYAKFDRVIHNSCFWLYVDGTAKIETRLMSLVFFSF